MIAYCPCALTPMIFTHTIYICMPGFLQFKKSTQHRVAGSLTCCSNLRVLIHAVFALYKALLSRCSSMSIAVDDRALLRNAIRKKFRSSRKLQSPRHLNIIFRAAYEVRGIMITFAPELTRTRLLTASMPTQSILLRM